MSWVVRIASTLSKGGGVSPFALTIDRRPMTIGGGALTITRGA